MSRKEKKLSEKFNDALEEIRRSNPGMSDTEALKRTLEKVAPLPPKRTPVIPKNDKPVPPMLE